jgi:DNA-binding NtrC family response regulator
VVSASQLPGINGLELLTRIRTVSAAPFVLEIEAGDIATAVAGVRMGADEVVARSHAIDEIGQLAVRIADNAKLSTGSELDRRLPGKSKVLQRMRQKLGSLAALRVPVLLVGESGSGRSYAASLLSTVGRSDKFVFIVEAESSAACARELPTRGSVFLRTVHAFSRTEQARWSDVVSRHEAATSGSRVRIMASTDADLDQLA